MFEVLIEKRIARNTEKIISLKEETEAMSWNRVVEIAQRLCQLDISEEVTDMAQELMGIAHSNTSLEAHLGFTPPRLNEQTTASGMRLIDDDAPFILDTEKADLLEKPLFADENMPKDLISDDAEGSVCDPFVKRVSPESIFDSELSAFLEGEESAKASAAASKAEAFAPAPAEPAAAVEASVAEPPAIAEAPVVEPPVADKPLPKPDITAPIPIIKETPVQEITSTPSPAPADAAKSKNSLRKKKFATFRNLYSSRDGGLCLYEDENGHLVAIDSTKLV